MMDLSDALLNADCVDTTLVCLRPTQTVDQHGLARNREEAIPFTGVVLPDSGNQLERTADGARVSAGITLHTLFQLFVGNETHDADSVIWQGRRYTVTAVADYSAFGFVCATGELLLLNG